jgi:small subunit ribosomal protein S2
MRLPIWAANITHAFRSFLACCRVIGSVIRDGEGGGKTQRRSDMSANISMKALLESGVHFGHRTNKWDPRMRPYIFTERNGIHIIDLQQTVKYLETAYNVIRDTVANGGILLFVGTKRQAQETVEEEAIRCGMPYVTERWLPGTLTNWNTIFQRIMELERLEKVRDSGEINQFVKKEGLLIEREISRLMTSLAGIRNMKRLPDMLFIIDVSRETTAVHEANLKGVPVVAVVDTNCDPSGVDYLIPANDDAIRAIKLLVASIADAVLEGKALRKEEPSEEMAALEGRGTLPGEGTHVAIELEEDFEDEDLLGESVLARLATSRRLEEEEKAKEAEGVEGAEKPVEVTEEKIEESKEPITEVKAKKVEPATPEAEVEKKAEAKKPEKKKKIISEAEKSSAKAESTKTKTEKPAKVTAEKAKPTTEEKSKKVAKEAKKIATKAKSNQDKKEAAPKAAGEKTKPKASGKKKSEPTAGKTS